MRDCICNTATLLNFTHVNSNTNAMWMLCVLFYIYIANYKFVSDLLRKALMYWRPEGYIQAERRTKSKPATESSSRQKL